MIEQSMLDAVKQYTANLSKAVTFVLNPGEHEKRAELKEFLSDIASVSDKIQLEERAFEGARSPISFALEADGKPTGIVISGIPGGHEFTTLILAILQAGGGTPLKLDESIQALIKNVKQPLKFATFVSLSCTNCPDVMQTLNQFTLLNPLISSEMIEGSVFPELIEKYDIQGVPSVYLNGERFNDGRVEASKLIDKLLEKYPEIMQGVEQKASLPVQDVTVIGGGPAGAAAAIYAARKGLKVTIVADRIGGQVQDTNGIENLIGTIETTGPELGNQLMEHIKAYPITIKEKLSVKSVEPGTTHKLTLSTGELIETKTLIIASGASWKKLGVPGEIENMGKGVAYCPHCDGPFFKGKPVAVIGGGNSGVEAAIDLAGIVKDVTLVQRNAVLTADKVLIDAAEKRDNIRVITNAQTEEIEADGGHVTGIRYKDKTDGQEKEVKLDAVFVQIGLLPNTGFLGDVVKKTKFGEIEIDSRCRTSVPGIFAAGDCTTVPYKQIVIAIGEGAKASLSAFDYLIRQ